MSQEKVFGVDIGGSYIRVGLIEGERVVGRIVEEVAYEPEEVCSQVLEGVVRLGGAGSVRIGVGCAGHIDHNKGAVLFSPHLGWRDVPLAEMIVFMAGEKGLEAKVCVENDVNAAAWGEYSVGAGCGTDSMVAVFVGTGVGGGIVLGGRLLRGAYGGAAEVGHATYIPRGRRCHCGRLGCFESYAGGVSISEMFAEETGNHLKPSEIWRMRRTEPAAAKVFKTALNALAHLLLSLSAVLDVERFVLGGGVTRHCEGLTEEVAQLYRKMVEETWGVAADVVQAQLNADAALVGAGLLAV